MTHDDEITPLEKQAKDAVQRADYQQAQDLYQQVLARREHALGAEHPDLVTTLTALGEIQQTLAFYAEAEPLYQRALVICQNAYGPSDERTIRAIGDVAGILEEQERHDQAQPLYEEAVSLSKQHLGEEHVETALAVSKLARFYRVMGKRAEAEELFWDALTITEDPAQAAVTLNNFAYLKNEEKKYIEAEALLRIAIQMHAASMHTPRFAASLKNLAVALQGRGETVLARVLCQCALSICEQKLGAEHPQTTMLAHLLATLDGDPASDQLAASILSLVREDGRRKRKDGALREKVLCAEGRRWECSGPAPQTQRETHTCAECGTQYRDIPWYLLSYMEFLAVGTTYQGVFVHDTTYCCSARCANNFMEKRQMDIISMIH